MKFTDLIDEVILEQKKQERKAYFEMKKLLAKSYVENLRITVPKSITYNTLLIELDTEGFKFDVCNEYVNTIEIVVIKK